MNKYYIYGLYLGDAEFPFYIGKGCYRRMYVHFEPKSLEAKSLKNHIIKKAIADGVAIIPRKIYVGLDNETALMMERSYIAHFGRRDYNGGILANHTDGGDGVKGYKQSKVLIEMRISKIRGRPRTEEAKAKMRKPRTMPRTAEHAARISAATKGRKASNEEIANQLVATFNRRPEIWIKASDHFRAWNGESAYKFGRIHAIPESRISGMIGKFRKGWIPDQDPTWTNWASSR